MPLFSVYTWISGWLECPIILLPLHPPCDRRNMAYVFGMDKTGKHQHRQESKGVEGCWRRWKSQLRNGARCSWNLWCKYSNRHYGSISRHLFSLHRYRVMTILHVWSFKRSGTASPKHAWHLRLSFCFEPHSQLAHSSQLHVLLLVMRCCQQHLLFLILFPPRFISHNRRRCFASLLPSGFTQPTLSPFTACFASSRSALLCPRAIDLAGSCLLCCFSRQNRSSDIVRWNRLRSQETRTTMVYVFPLARAKFQPPQGNVRPHQGVRFYPASLPLAQQITLPVQGLLLLSSYEHRTNNLRNDVFCIHICIHVPLCLHVCCTYSMIWSPAHSRGLHHQTYRKQVGGRVNGTIT